MSRTPWHKLCPGCYTDDTQMSMALAELMLSSDEWTARAVADRFVRVFQRDPRKGYSKPFHSLLLEATTAELFLRDINADSVKNGAAMRSVPVGVHPDMAVVKARSEVQARVTHDTEEGAASAVAVSLMSHYFLYGLGTRDGLPAFLEEQVPVAGHSWRPSLGRRGRLGRTGHGHGRVVGGGPDRLPEPGPAPGRGSRGRRGHGCRHRPGGGLLLPGSTSATCPAFFSMTWKTAWPAVIICSGWIGVWPMPMPLPILARGSAAGE